MRIIYLGSPSFAVLPLEALAAAGHEITLVVTQPDRPAGRGRDLTPPPVKVAAERLGLPVFQPESLRDPAAVERLVAAQPEVGVVAAYGEILRKNVLAIPPLGYLNIHPSLLPLHRGPTPIHGAILAGDSETGVSIMRLDPGMDSGPLLAQAVVPLPATARSGPLTDELFQLGARMLVEVLPLYAGGQIEPRPQDHSQATVTRMLKKEDGQIDWSLPAIVIERMTRAYDPWPGAFTTWRSEPFKIRAAQVHQGATNLAEYGTFYAEEGRPIVVTGSGLLELIEVQPAGKRPMAGRDWIQGARSGQFGSTS
jgi:methionyl-tRNA formyltransferase